MSPPRADTHRLLYHPAAATHPLPQPSTMRVLLVEDDPLIGDGLRLGLSRLGIHADWVEGISAATQALDHDDYAAVVLDLGLPDGSGLELLRRARERGVPVPVLILTARDAIDDKLAGFATGADDYVVKPVAVEELAARLTALARRAGGWASPCLRCGEVELDLAARRVRRKGEEVALSGKELTVLELLMQNAGRVVTRSRIDETLYGWDEGAESNTVEVFIHHLRRKLGSDFIRTLRGIGYLIPRDEEGR